MRVRAVHRRVLVVAAVMVAAGLSAWATDPQISEVQVAATDTTATITWTTDVASDSTVTYGLSTPPGLTASDSSSVTSHSVTLQGLTECRLYFFSVTSGGITDNNGGLYYTFTTQHREYAFGPDNVEGGTNNWTVTTTNGSQWAIDACRSASGDYAWKAGEHDSPDCTADCLVETDSSLRRDQNSWLELDESATPWTLRWKEWLESSDSGSCAVWLFDSSRHDLVTAYGGTTGWRDREASLEGYSGTVNVGFDFTTSGSFTGEGWYVDDIEVSRLVPCAGARLNQYLVTDACSGAGSGGDGVLDPGETATLMATVYNPSNESIDADNVVVTLTTSTSGVSISPASVTVGTLTPYGWDEAPFSIGLSRGLSCGSEVDLMLVVKSDQSIERTPVTLYVGSAGSTALSQNFASGDPPTGWQALDLTDNDPPETWTTSDPGSRYPPAGISSPFEILDSDYLGDGHSQDAVLVTPTLDLSSATGAELAFDTLFFSLEDGTDSAAVEVTTDGSTWTPIASWGVSVGTPPADPEDTETDPGEAVRVVLDLSAAAGHSTVAVRFRYQGSWGWYWVVDNVEVRAWNAESSCSDEVCCAQPTGLSAPTVTDVDGACADSGVRVSWNQDPSGAWGDEGIPSPYRGYRVFRDATDASGFIAYGTTTWVDTDGTNNTSFDYTVRSENGCDSKASTGATSGQDAYTPAAPTITGDATNACPATSVVLSTEGGMSNYQWRKDGSPVGTNSNTYTAEASGTYTVSYTNGSGCSGTSAGHAVTIQACAVAPAPDGRGGTTPMRGVKATGGNITVTFDSTTCPAPSYNLYYGALSNVSTYTWAGSECGITSGSSWTTVPSGNTFWIIVGDSGPMESSWGYKRIGGVESQRSTTASSNCGNTSIDTTSQCPSP